LFDFIIIGAGLAGLSTALELGKLGRVAVLYKSPLMFSSSAKAQGGIAASIGYGDSPELHGKDILEAGRGLCRVSAVEVLVRKAGKSIKRLEQLGVNFKGFTKEAGHSRDRIIYTGSDLTGQEVLSALYKKVLENSRISLYEGVFARDLIVEDCTCRGVTYFDRGGKVRKMHAPFVVLASGGIGAIYKFTTNPESNTGDGIAMAFRAGAKIADMEFVQFHPTAFAGGEGSFLITETLRGEGAVLRNHNGRRFMKDYHPRAELAPRDVVSRAIYNEMQKEGKDFVLLDATKLGSKFLRKRFPQVYTMCKEAGYLLEKDWIPVRPAAHFIMGGVVTDLWGRTNISGLYACGEVACTGVHGANRLASNSLLEALVFSERIAEHISSVFNKTDKSFRVGKGEESSETRAGLGNGIPSLEEFYKKVYSALNIVRNRERLEKLLDYLEGFQEVQAAAGNKESIERLNMQTVAKIIALAALKREETRGAHCREEFPSQDRAWDMKHIIFQRGGRMEVEKWI